MTIRALALMLAAGLGTLGAVSVGLSQDFKQGEPDVAYYYDPADTSLDAKAKKRKDDDARQQLGIIRELLSEGVGMTPERDRMLKKWYVEYFFPAMTVANDEVLRKTPDLRKLFIRDLDRSNTEQPAVHDFVVDLTYEYFSKVAVEDYHPAVRYNAMLILGSLNLKEKETSGGNPHPPIPLTKSFSFMLEQFENKDQIDAVRLATLIGMQRHLQLEAQYDAKPVKIPAAELSRVRTALLDLVNTTNPPAERSVGGHNWLRRRGVELLGWLGAAKIDQEIFDVLLARLSDGDDDRGVRCEAALALSNLMYVPDPARPAAGAAPIDAKPREVAAELARFVVQSTNTDIAAVDDYIKSIEEAERIYGGGGVGGFGGFGAEAGAGAGAASRPRRGSGPPTSRMSPMGPGAGSFGGSFGQESKVVDPYAFRLEPVYRKLRYEISCAMKGLRGTEDWSNRPAPGGIATLVPAMTADLGDPKNKALKDNPDRAYLDSVARGLKSLAEALRVKDDELQFEVFDKEVKKLAEGLNKVVLQAIPVKAGADPKAKPAAVPVEDPLTAEDPAAEPEPAAAKAEVPAKAKPAPAPAPEPEPEP